jgi:hypothetical protein
MCIYNWIPVPLVLVGIEQALVPGQAYKRVQTPLLLP